MPHGNQSSGKQESSNQRARTDKQKSNCAKVYVTRNGGRYVDAKEFINSPPAQKTLKQIKTLRPHRTD